MPVVEMIHVHVKRDFMAGGIRYYVLVEHGIGRVFTAPVSCLPDATVGNSMTINRWALA